MCRHAVGSLVCTTRDGRRYCRGLTWLQELAEAAVHQLLSARGRWQRAEQQLQDSGLQQEGPQVLMQQLVRERAAALQAVVQQLGSILAHPDAISAQHQCLAVAARV